VIIATTAAPDLSAAFLGKEHVYMAGEAISWVAALGPVCAAQAALVARPFSPPPDDAGDQGARRQAFEGGARR
jgi:hypothetical protein